MNKATRNYWVDVILAVAFVAVLASSIANLVPLSWIDFTVAEAPKVMGLSYAVWGQMHKWGGIAMLVGVGVHLLLHIPWIKSMTARVFQKKEAK